MYMLFVVVKDTKLINQCNSKEVLTYFFNYKHVEY